MTRASPREAVRAAERAYGLVQSKPARALVLAEEAVGLARSRRDVEALAVALHALGFARYVLGDPRGARTMRQAIQVADRHGLPERAATARRNLAIQLAYRGELSRAVAEVDAALAGLDGIEAARGEVFRIAVYSMAGRAEAALPYAAAAMKELRRRDDRLWEARLAYNRGASFAERGQHRPARRDLERARVLYEELGFDAAVADARIKLALLASLEGDPLRCLQELDAIDLATLTDWAAAWVYLDRAEAYLALRLVPEAQTDLGRFIDVLVRARAADALNKARLDAARLALAAGDAGTAGSLAEGARRSFSRLGQRPFAASATVVMLAAAIAENRVRPSLARAAHDAASVLVEEGWSLQALRAHALLAHEAALAGKHRALEHELAAARPLERRGTVADRIELCHVEALALLGAGEGRRAEARLRRGLALLEEHRAGLGAAELRATTSSLGVDLAREGLRLALGSEAPRDVLAWAERLRGNALRLPAVRPAADRKLRAAQRELQQLARRAREDPSARVSTRRAELESVVRTRLRLVRGMSSAIADVALDSAVNALGDRALVEYVEIDGRLLAITLVDGRLRLHELEPGSVDRDLEWLRFGLTRLARGRLSPAQRAAARANTRAAAEALDGALLTPLGDELGGAALVLVPTGLLHALPWAALPSLRGRPVVVAPSLSQWLALAGARPAGRGGTVLLAGPGLRHAAGEIRDVAALLPRATALTGADATVGAALAALDGAALAHVACHGRFRADSPLFSSLELADGPLTALDLQGLRRTPDTLVLSACDVALSERHPGDELLGLSAALLSMATRTIVASVVPVPDRAARRLLLAFHRRLLTGSTPAAALAKAQANATVPGFVCLGNG
jgi:CHAT domain-containing protein